MVLTPVIHNSSIYICSYQERNEVNLHFDVLDSPEFFWEQDKFKHVYDRLFGYLELQKRVDVLNKRLDILKELYSCVQFNE